MLKRVENWFERDTAVARIDAGVFEAEINRRWWITTAPNGGYLAVILLRAMAEFVSDVERAPRSLTVHYTTPAEAGPAKVETRIERTGTYLTTISARMTQGERLIALALGAFSRSRTGNDFQHAVIPDVSPLEHSRPLREQHGPEIPIHDRYETRWAVKEQPWTAGDRARSGAWIRLKQPQIVDSFVVAALTDAIAPAVLARGEPGDGPIYVPTIDLTIHFRTSLPVAGARPGDFVLAVFNTRVLRDGFLEEDGEIWAPEGLLLAQSRQLAILVQG